jgi:hypothetical protein
MSEVPQQRRMGDGGNRRLRAPFCEIMRRKTFFGCPAAVLAPKVRIIECRKSEIDGDASGLCETDTVRLSRVPANSLGASACIDPHRHQVTAGEPHAL